MNCWISGHRRSLDALLKEIDCLMINEDEAKMLAESSNLVKAGESILAMGPRVVIIKKGEYGSLMCEAGGKKFLLPAYPATEVRDPTGAGDSFAGGVMGYLSQAGRTDFDSLKAAMAYGTVVASFTIADFSLQKLTSISRADISKRYELLRKVTQF